MEEEARAVNEGWEVSVSHPILVWRGSVGGLDCRI